VPGLAQPGRGFDPAERLFDPLPDALADRVAGVAGGATIDGRPSAGQVLRHMRRDAHRPQVRDVLPGVIDLVGSDSDPATTWVVSDLVVEILEPMSV